MARPTNPTPSIQKSYKLPEDVINIIENQQGKDGTEKLINLARKIQKIDENAFDNIDELITQGKKLIHTGFEKIIKAENKRAIIKAQEIIDKKKEETKKILELEKIWFAEIPKILENPKKTREEAVIYWINILMTKGKEYAHIDSSPEIFNIFEEEYDLSKEKKKTIHEEELDKEIEEMVEEEIKEE